MSGGYYAQYIAVSQKIFIKQMDNCSSFQCEENDTQGLGKLPAVTQIALTLKCCDFYATPLKTILASPARAFVV